MDLNDIADVMSIAETVDQAPRWDAEAYHRALDRSALPARIGLVAEDPEVGISGFLVAVLIPPQAELETIVVAESARRRGIARHLLAQLFADLNEKQIVDVLLEVRESNHPALELYRTLGFITIGRRTRYYSEPEEDAILMQRSVMGQDGAFPDRD